MTARKLQELVECLEYHAPSECAESWDNVGLLVGDPGWQVRGAIVTIDLTRQAIQAALDRNFNVIVTHHPCIFPKRKGLSRITGGHLAGKAGLVFDAVREGLGVISCHTNFDRCAIELIHWVGKGLGITPRGRLLSDSDERSSCLKLVVFVPPSHVDPLRRALAEAGAGQVGDYDFCSFSAEGEGRFKGSEFAQPFLGVPGRLEIAREVRVETILPRGLKKTVIQAMIHAHPYEEVAYDLYPVEQSPSTLGLIKGLGYGFWGEFPHARPFSEVCKDVRSLFKATGFLYTNLDNIRQERNRSNRRKIPKAPGKGRGMQRVAFAAGSGASVVESAMAVGCDLMITGEVGYHDALGASFYRPECPMAIMELGHRESERFFVPVMQQWLSEAGVEAVGVHLSTQKYIKL